MADYGKAFEYMMDDEDRQRKGVIVSDPEPQAPAARARFGLNSYWHPDLLAKGFFTYNADATPKIPSPEALLIAAEVYRTDYWSLIKGYSICNQDIANKFFSLFVNSEHDATKYVQRACNKVLTGQPGFNLLQVDGACGPATIEALNRANAATLLAAIKEYAVEFYKATGFRMNWSEQDTNEHIARAQR